jgi:AcrR family transcriptional regulator
MLAGADRSRVSILDAAQALFAQQGYAATSMREIANHAGLAPGGIYNHFPAKETIFKAILGERHPYQSLGHLLTPGIFDHKTAQSLLNELDQHPEFFNLMLIELVEFKGRHLTELFENILRDLPSPAPWRAFLSMVVSYHLTRLLLANTLPPGTQQISPDAFIDLFLHETLKPE